MINHFATTLDIAVQDFYAESLLPHPNMVRLQRLREQIDKSARAIRDDTRETQRGVAQVMERTEQRLEVGR